MANEKTTTTTTATSTVDAWMSANAERITTARYAYIMDAKDATVAALLKEYDAAAKASKVSADDIKAFHATVEKKAPRYIAITMTPALFIAAEKARGTAPVGTYLQRIVAEKLDVKITAKQSTRGKYAGLTGDAKKAAVKADKVKASRLVEMMMEKYAADMENLQKELEERMAKEAAEAAATATPAAA